MVTKATKCVLTSSPVCSDCPSCAALSCAESMLSSSSSSVAISSGDLPWQRSRKEDRKEPASARGHVG